MPDGPGSARPLPMRTTSRRPRGSTSRATNRGAARTANCRRDDPVEHLHHVFGNRRPEEMSDSSGDGPFRAEQGKWNVLRSTDRVEPAHLTGSHHVDRSAGNPPGGEHEGPCRVGLVQHAVARRRQHVERHEWKTQQPPEWARDVGTDHRSQTQRRHLHRRAVERAISRVFEMHEHAAVLRGGCQRSVLVGPVGSVTAPSIHLDARTQHDVTQGGCPATSREHALGGQTRVVLGESGVHPGVGFPHAEMDDDMGIEFFHHRRGPHQVGRLDEMERGLRQPSARGVEVDAHDALDPRLAFEFGCDERTQLSAHTGDEDPRTRATHDPDPSPVQGVLVVFPRLAGIQRRSTARRIRARALESS